MRLTTRRAAFRHWRRTRPFWAGLFVMAGGMFIIAPPLAPIKAMLTGGPAVTTGVAVGVILVAAGVVFWIRPVQRVFTSVVAAAFSVISFATTNFGGLGIGMLLGIIGSSMAFGWREIPPAEGARDDGEAGDQPDGGEPRRWGVPDDERRDEKPPSDGDAGEPDPTRVVDLDISVTSQGAGTAAGDPGPVHRLGSMRQPQPRRRLLRGAAAATAVTALGVIAAAPAHAQACLPSGIPWPSWWSPAPPACTGPMTLGDMSQTSATAAASAPPRSPDPAETPPASPHVGATSAPPSLADAPGTPAKSPGPDEPIPSPSESTPAPKASGDITYQPVPPATEQADDGPLPARIAPTISADRLDANALQIKGSRWLETPTGRTKVLVLHATSITLTNYQLTTAQSGPGLTLRFDVTVNDVDLYMASLSGVLRIAGLPLRISLSADLIPDFLPLDITLPQLSLDTVEAKQTLIVSPDATFTGLKIVSRAGEPDE
ncbi:DUF6114 domain-containing protein [Streptomyces fulvoviolaceus]|uniref:DUF6114 domain-containing protein n=1 Tax=Streptomyces fulvoviolaceus TaxID=285535 RepID=UPI0004C85AC7|nr:DUF6114 domain-containing protein [Streptomyces fulvoviolaceus]